MHQERRRLENEIDDLEEKLWQAARAVAGEEGKIYTAMELRMHGDYACGVARRIQERRAALEKLDLRLTVKRAEVVEALRAVKTLERLRARLEEKFRLQQNVDEQKTADEIAEQRFSGSQGGQKLPARGKLFPS
jgi:flagellar export protein FliJ